jgi:hypothetical protein
MTVLASGCGSFAPCQPLRGPRSPLPALECTAAACLPCSPSTNRDTFTRILCFRLRRSLTSASLPFDCRPAPTSQRQCLVLFVTAFSSHRCVGLDFANECQHFSLRKPPLGISITVSAKRELVFSSPPLFVFRSLLGCCCASCSQSKRRKLWSTRTHAIRRSLTILCPGVPKLLNPKQNTHTPSHQPTSPSIQHTDNPKKTRSPTAIKHDRISHLSLVMVNSVASLDCYQKPSTKR